VVAITVSSLTVEQVYVAGVIYFGMNAALASISAFLPTILKTLGFGQFTSPLLRAIAFIMRPTLANATAQLLTVPPYALAIAVLFLFSYIQ